MSLELTGKLVNLLNQESGDSKQKPGTQWVKQNFIMETPGDYPKKVCITAWSENVKKIQEIPLESNVKAFFNLESREFNGKWYTDAKLWKIEVVSGSVPPPPGDSPSGNRTMNAVVETAEPLQNNNMQEDDLPF